MKSFIAVALPIVVIAACGKSQTGEPTTPAASAAPAETTAASEQEPAEAPAASGEPEADKPPEKKKDLTGCEARFAEIDKVLSQATYTCKKDADCGCFDVGVSRTPGSECGGVVEKAIAQKLDPLVKAAKKESCQTSAMCEAWTCDPMCEAGQCRKKKSK
jgi:hypothetical protein